MLDVRYQGQSYELRVPLSSSYRRAFHTAHRALYGHADEGRAVEVVNLRVVATAPAARHLSFPALAGALQRPARAPASHRMRWHGRWLRTRRVERGALPIGCPLAGPIVITELSATTVVPPAWAVRVGRRGDLLLESHG